jgi:hypothetical protein
VSTVQPTEEELRAYEEELSRITSTQLVLQASASLLNVGGRRLGLAQGSEQERDLDQVQDAIDAVMALMPILERRMPPDQAQPLREALSQLQMAYARACQPAPVDAEPAQATRTPAQPTSPPEHSSAKPSGEARSTQDPTDDKVPGPAERSGRLWVPGR